MDLEETETTLRWEYNYCRRNIRIIINAEYINNPAGIGPILSDRDFKYCLGVDEIGAK